MWSALQSAILWLNVWARLNACEQQRAGQQSELISMRAEDANNKERMASLETAIESFNQLLSVGTISVSAQGTIIEAGARFADMCGYSVIELIGMQLSNLIPNRYRAEHSKEFALVTDGSKPLRTSPMEVEMRHKEGREVQILVTLSATDAGSGKIIRADVRRR